MIVHRLAPRRSAKSPVQRTAANRAAKEEVAGLILRHSGGSCPFQGIASNCRISGRGGRIHSLGQNFNLSARNRAERRALPARGCAALSASSKNRLGAPPHPRV